VSFSLGGVSFSTGELFPRWGELFPRSWFCVLWVAFCRPLAALQHDFDAAPQNFGRADLIAKNWELVLFFLVRYMLYIY